ncbi:nucleotide sugar dehydrogenase [Gammaproteobacteria bacterium]|nr:nucleotide sugar dehydrogenase [Gammaproteobacteria bacterium]
MTDNNIVVGVVGLGYVGLPLAKSFLQAGVKVAGFDLDESKVKNLNKGDSPLEIFPSSYLREALSNKQFQAHSSFLQIKKCDAVIICVPTPLDQFHQPDLSSVVSSINSITKHLKKGALVSLESTTYPGTSSEIIKPILESQGLKVGKDIFLCYSPEREDPGNHQYTLKNTPKVISGYTKACLSRSKKIYSLVCDTLVPVSSLEAAELCKLLENIQRSVNIGLMNELRLFAEKTKINLFEVIDAASTKPFGFTPYYPGPGVGGHCIPIDPFYLTYKAREYGIHTRFIELAGEVNEAMPDYIIRRVGEVLNLRKKSFSNSKILCIGLSYKKNVGDVRESPSVQIFDKLLNLGAQAAYHDPFVPSFPKMRKYNIKSKSVPLTEKSIKKYDLVLINTLHDQIDAGVLYQHSKIIVDSAGSLRTLDDPKKKIILV